MLKNDNKKPGVFIPGSLILYKLITALFQETKQIHRR